MSGLRVPKLSWWKNFFKLDSLIEVNGMLEVQEAGNFRVDGEISK